jgi:hypothetical protein
MKTMYLRIRILFSSCILAGLFFGFIPSVFSQVPVPGSEGKTSLQWMPDLDTALQEAEKTKKPILLDITTDWSDMSKKMEKEIFAAPGVQRQLKKFILVRINPEASEKNRNTAKKYVGSDPTDYPYLIVLNYRGEEISQESGYQHSTSLVKLLKDSTASLKENPLGYKSTQLPPDDPLIKAIAKMPKTETLPSSIGSIILLDQCSVILSTNATAKMTTRTAHYIIDPDQHPQPHPTVYYNSSREKVKIKSARVFDRTGLGRDLDVSKPQPENEYSRENIYWDMKSISLPIPSLKEGQILDVIEEREIQPVMPGHFFWRWVTGGQVIVAGDLTITFPEKLGLLKHAVQCTATVTESKSPSGEITWHLLTQNLNQAEPEIYSPDPSEEWQGYAFVTPTKWDDIAAWFSGLCEGRLALPPETKEKIAALKKSNPEPAQLLQGIFDMVTKEIRYVSVNFGISSHQPHPAADTIRNQYGDCKDQALLMKALCAEAGIPASLILLNAGYGNQIDSRFPSVYLFDHCIMEANAGGKLYYLDPSAGAAKIDRPPLPDCAGQALRVAEKKGEIITLPLYSATENHFYKKIIKLNPNGSATITEIEEMRGLAAHSTKEYLRRFTSLEKIRKQAEASFKADGKKLIDLSMTDFHDRSDRFERKLTYTTPRFGTRTPEGFTFKLLREQEEDQEWIGKLEVPRVRPFKFIPTDPEVSVYDVEIPANATVKSKIEDLNIETSFMRVSRKTSTNGNKFVLTEKSLLLDAHLPATDAPKVLAEFRKLVDHRNRIIVISIPTNPSDPK